MAHPPLCANNMRLFTAFSHRILITCALDPYFLLQNELWLASAQMWSGLSHKYSCMHGLGWNMQALNHHHSSFLNALTKWRSSAPLTAAAPNVYNAGKRVRAPRRSISSRVKGWRWLLSPLRLVVITWASHQTAGISLVKTARAEYAMHYMASAPLSLVSRPRTSRFAKHVCGNQVRLRYIH
jgi:hypothetical protein